ncbi:uracil-DNA glycosylase [Halorussus salilacus]|uniref:uracil-DNA glycosylase n=1 Tax=Halorussus salilacus TaxID=2953750 RepID=UPI00209D5843|nr:uracil-DNA glycosylase family protein [Halorussus salilacus]USZ67079.1 uracil-DNA glycosylase [Halorussus salilacus]
MADFPDPDSRLVLEPDCARCPALVESRERIAWGNGDPDADVVVVGEAPAFGNPDAETWRGGNRTGMAYTSRHSGRAVRDLFADAGFADACYFTNAVKCFPADGDDPETNREPTAEERANCRGHLRTEIERVDPAVVATTGTHATLAVLGEDALSGGFLDSVLEPVESAEFDAVVLPLVHPSYQNVWLPRLGYAREEYVAAIRSRIAALV